MPGTTPIPNADVSSSAPSITDKTSVEDSFKTNDTGNYNNVTNASTGYSNSSNPIVTTNDSTNEVRDEKEDSLIPITTTQTNVPVTTDTGKTPEPSKESYWDKNKTWLKPVAIGVGGIGLIAIGFSMMKPKHIASRSSPNSLSGIPKSKRKNHKRKNKHKSKSKSKPYKKTAVALL